MKLSMRMWKTLSCVVLSHGWVPLHNGEEPYRECRRCGKRDFVNYHPAGDFERLGEGVGGLGVGGDGGGGGF